MNNYADIHAFSMFTDVTNKTIVNTNRLPPILIYKTNEPDLITFVLFTILNFMPESVVIYIIIYHKINILNTL